MSAEGNTKYQRSPLFEAVFEIDYFISNWSPVTPGLFFNTIKSEFPIISQVKTGPQVSFNKGTLSIGDGVDNAATLFYNDKGNLAVQLRRNALSIHAVKDYSGWREYYNAIQFVIKGFNHVFDRPQINKIGLRYLNKVYIESHSVNDVKKNFTIYPMFPEGIISKDTNGVINLVTEIPLYDDKECFSIILASLGKEQPDQYPMLFQISKTMIRDIPASFGDWLNEAHQSIFDVFEKGLTEYCKAQLR